MNANVRDAGVEEDPTIVVKDISSAHLRLMMQVHNSIGNFWLELETHKRLIFLRYLYL